MLTKHELFNLGVQHITEWCRLNRVEMPDVVLPDADLEIYDPARFGVCAYYRDNQIVINIDRCSAIGTAGRRWSYPGYVVDRTPFGVLAHELGHHVDRAHGPAGGVLSHLWRPLDAVPITGYAPNDNEWFAELFRVFVTNPDLFQKLRPKIADLFFSEWPERVERRPWIHVLFESPRHVRAAENKIRKVAA